MTRKTFNEDVPLPPHGAIPLPAQRQMRCSPCGAETPVEVLNNFGGRCGRCFTAYCRAMPELPKSPWKREEIGERAYAAARLSTWEERHGQRMTPSQREFLDAVKGAINRRQG